MKSLKTLGLFRTFSELKGNPKWSLITEPLWYIPFALFSPFASLYMYQLGLSSEQIGITISVGYFLQVFFSLIGGVVTDKLGRRKTTFIFDTIAWSIPCFIWAFADNFWLFLLASCINASYQITNASWSCLFIEDCPQKHLTNAFTLVHLCGMLSVFFSPLAIYFVDRYSVIEVVSVIYFISGLSMTAKFVLLYIHGKETTIGEARILETKDVSYLTLLSGYKGVLQKILKSSNMMFVLLFMSLSNIILITTANFFSLYITETLSIPDDFVAIFPMIRTLIMLIFVLLLQDFLQRLKMKNSLLFAFTFYIASHLILLMAPSHNIYYILAYTVLESIAYAIVIPRKDALMASYVDIEERSRIYAIFNAGTIAISVPFGFIIGKIFEWNTTYPFVLNLIIFVICIIMIFLAKAVKNYDDKVQND